MLTTQTIVSAALARRRRERTLRPADLRAIVARLDADWSELVTIPVSASLARRAGELAERLSLRGLDAVHLASFERLLERADDSMPSAPSVAAEGITIAP